MKQHPFLRAILAGVFVMLLLSVALSGVFAGAIQGGLIPASGIGVISCIITFLSGLVGGGVCAGRAGGKRLPLSLACGAVYWLLIFVLRGLVFRNVSDRLWLMPVFLLAGCLLGAFAASGRKRKRFH